MDLYFVGFVMVILFVFKDEVVIEFIKFSFLKFLENPPTEPNLKPTTLLEVYSLTIFSLQNFVKS